MYPNNWVLGFVGLGFRGLRVWDNSNSSIGFG